MALPLFKYQDVGAAWLASGPRVLLLADEMGIGKTAQAIVGCDRVGAQSIVVICPAIMRAVWAREFARFSNVSRPIQIITNTDVLVAPEGVVIASFEGATAVLIQAQLRKRGADVLIIDEAHNLKERDTQRTKAVYGTNCDAKDGIAQNARRIWALTGTPAPNHAAELYPIMRLSGVWRAGYWPFAKQFTKGYTSRYGYKISGNDNVPELRAMLGQIMLRRKRADVLQDMPRLTISELTVAPTEVSPSRFILDELSLRSKKITKAIDHALATDDWSMTAIESVSIVRRLIGQAKVKHVAKYIQQELQADPSAKFVVFAIHRDAIKYLAAYLAHYRARIIYGGTPDEKKTRYIDSFQANPLQRVIICQMKTASAGITLTAANRLLIMEASWTPADNFQAIMRAYRIGQTRPVLAQFVSLAGSIDEAVNATLIRKTQAISALFD